MPWYTGTGRAPRGSRWSRNWRPVKDVLLEIDWQGASQVRAQVPEAVSVFILPPSRQALEQRMRSRGQDSEATIARRLAAAREEMSHYDEFDYVIVNEDSRPRSARCARSSMPAGCGGRRNRRAMRG